MKKKRIKVIPIISDDQKKQIAELIFKIVGDSIKARLARAAGAATVAAATQICSGDKPAEAPAEAPPPKEVISVR